MANQNFEKLLEYIVNGEQEKAEELFHSLVVNKSREIYESLFEEEMEDVEVDEASCKDMDEESDEEIEEDTVEEAFIAFSEEPAGMGEIDDEKTDNMLGDIDTDDASDDMDDMDSDDMDNDDLAGKVEDLEDALEDLKAEFEKLMADEENEPEHHDGKDDPDFGSDDKEEEEDSEEEEEESFNFEDIEDIDLSPVEQMREYVEKVGETYKGGKVAGSSEAAGTNTKSTVAKPNKMGGTAANIVSGGVGSEKGTEGGLLSPKTKEDNAGNVNVPGPKNATKLSPVAKGHGAEKKGAPEDAQNKKSIIGSRG